MTRKPPKEMIVKNISISPNNLSKETDLKKTMIHKQALGSKLSSTEKSKVKESLKSLKLEELSQSMKDCLQSSKSSSRTENANIKSDVPKNVSINNDVKVSSKENDDVGEKVKNKNIGDERAKLKNNDKGEAGTKLINKNNDDTKAVDKELNYETELNLAIG